MFRAYLILSVAAFGIFFVEESWAEQSGTERLMEGNKRYVADALVHPNRTSERREAVSSKQEPFAVIVGCADSRVSPEILFDQGVGDLFVVRVAGNVVGLLELESIRFSAVQLHSSTILVLGHERCGAINAVVEKTTEGISAIAALIEPNVEKVRAAHSSDLLVASIKENARAVRNQLSREPTLQKLISEGKLEVRAGYYNLETGAVELLD